jgi:HAD superfamily hydrolase (TIGR01549 family)
MTSSISLEQYLKQHPKTHLIFDLDKTICWLILPWQHWQDKIKEKLIAVDKPLYQKYIIGKISLSELQNQYISKFPSTKQLFIKNNTWFETTLLQNTIPNPQIMKFIKNSQNSSPYTFYLWSSNTKKTVTAILKKYTLSRRFKKIITCNDIAMIKPHPEGFTLIKEKNIPLTNYLFIGDSKSDKQAAQAVGIDFFQVTYFNKKSLILFVQNEEPM